LLAICGLVAVDYVRCERIYVSAARQATAGHDSTTVLSKNEIGKLASLTFQDFYADQMLVRTFDIDKLLAAEKIDISKRVLGGLVNSENLGRHIALLIVDGKRDEAVSDICRARRNDDLYKDTIRMLERLSIDDVTINSLTLEKCK
jgi:hypothetical protein